MSEDIAPVPNISPSGLVPPTLDDVRRAAGNIAAHMETPTPLIYSPGLSERFNAHVSLKLETATPIAAFKLRGGIHLMAEMPAAERATGVVVASTGNHGQSIAYAARIFGISAHVFAPEGANTDKVAAMERLGAHVTLHGTRYDDARLKAEEYAAEHALRYIHASDEPALIAGVATAALEVLEAQQPSTDCVIVPVGAGSGACGWVTVRDSLSHPARIWAAQSAQAPAVHDAWRAGHPVQRANTTFAEGLATAEASHFPIEILTSSLDEFILVEDAEIADAVRALLDLSHVLAEPAGAASTAAGLREVERLRSQRLVLVVSGANITRAQMRTLI